MKELYLNITKKYTPLQIILALGIFFRLLASFFAKGFGWHDDHFLIIESSQSWADGFDYNYWLPDPNFPDRVPQGHSFSYVGIHYFLFKIFSYIGIYDPQIKMTIIRLLHALYSILLITYGYKIVEKLASKREAIYAAAFISLFWFMPFFSVRNLAEYVCIPPLFIATWLFIKERNWSNYFFAGIWIGLAFSLRFQSLFLSAGLGIALLILKTPVKYLLSTILGFAVIVLLSQGFVDYLIWKKPFAEFAEYVKYNLENAQTYGTDVWHMYFDLILGLLIPPLSILLFIGWIYEWKRLPLLFWPVFVYLAFHIYFPNKQERFVVSILPTLILAGTIGMFRIYDAYREKFKPGLLKFSKYFVISLNTLLIFIFCFTYSKKNRCEPMYYLYKQPDLRMVMIEDSNKENDFLMPPLFYLGKWHSVIGITKNNNLDSASVQYYRMPEDAKPNYVVFLQGENIDQRVLEFRKKFNGVEYITTIEPGMIDKILKWLNPINDNESAYIFKFTEPKMKHDEKNNN